MVYLLFILVCCNYLAYLRRLRELDFKSMLLYSSPVIFFWCLLIGGQYGVGTDYFNYLDMFTNGDLSYVEEGRGEYGFSYFIRSCFKLGIHGQGIFFVIAFIWSIIFLFVVYNLLGSKYFYLYLFAFIVFTGGFNNQMNGIRQYCAIYILWLAFTFLWQRQYIKSLLFFLLSPLFHQSAIVAIFVGLLMFLVSCYCRKRVLLYGILLIGTVCSILMTDEFISYFIPYFELYSDYLNRGAVEERSFILIISKLIYLPLFVCSIYLFPKMNIDEPLRRLFVFGICGYAWKLSTVSLALVSRLGLYFEFFSCIPLIYLLIYCIQKKYLVVYYSTIIYLTIPYSVKVLMYTFGSGEYSYTSYILRYI